MTSVSQHHGLATHEVVLLLETDAQRGLTRDKAARRLQRFGPNVLPAIKAEGPLLRFVGQFLHPLIYVLLGAGAVTLRARRDRRHIGHLRSDSGERLRRVRPGVEGEAALDALRAMVTRTPRYAVTVT